MENKIWTFGDSHTAGHGCTHKFEYYQKYYKEGDRIWPEHLALYLNLNLINKGRGGSSNDMILDSIVDSFDDIKEGDIVIIGKTYTHRFDIPHPKNNKLVPIFWDWNAFAPTPIISEFTQEQIGIVVDFLYHFMDSPLFDKRWDKRYEWVKSILESKGCRVIVWDVNKEIKKYESIYIDTNRKIEDHHMSFNGHKEFALYMYSNHFKEKSLL